MANAIPISLPPRVFADQALGSPAVQAAIAGQLAQLRSGQPQTRPMRPAQWLAAKLDVWRPLRRSKTPAALGSADPARAKRRLNAQAHRAALDIAANFSRRTVLPVASLMMKFMRLVYERMEIQGLERIAALARDHALVYVPCHRSHMDYLLLSLLLLERGLTIPHIAAGDNLNLPIIGGLLRRCGAVFMRRSFRNDAIYAAVFSEYIREVHRRGYCLELFPEGGRSRTGRLMPAKLGLLRMTLAHVREGLPQPIVFVPVYLGYEKLIESAAYVDELRGAKKRRESYRDILRGLKLIGQRHGRVDLNIGQPLHLDEWLAQRPADDAQEAAALGRELLERVNLAASVHPVNLVAMALLCTPRQAMEARALEEQIDCCLELLHRDAPHQDLRVTKMDGAEVIDHVVGLGLLTREPQAFGATLAAEPAAAVLLTWYRNNTIHVLALPALLAFLLQGRRLPIQRERLQRMAATVFPYCAWELHVRYVAKDIDRWLDHLVASGLVAEDAGHLSPPPPESPARHRLHLLANLIRQTLERQYIVLSLLTRRRTQPPNRAELQAHSQRIAHKMARLYGIDAPEFFDPKLFDGFVDKLLSDGVVSEGADGRLGYAPIVQEVMRASAHFIDAEFRHAVLRA